MSLAFVATTHRGDSHLAYRLLWQLNTYHPRAEKIFITDGKLQDWQTRALEGMCDTLIHGEALGQNTARPTAWLERMLRLALEHTSAEIIVKLDPDAYLFRAIRSYPGADLFGTLYADGTVTGGVYGFRRDTARRVLESGLLERVDFQLLQPQSPLPVNEERQFSHAVQALEMTTAIWSEVCARARPVYSAREVELMLLKLEANKQDLRVPAVLHPIKDFGRPP